MKPFEAVDLAHILSPAPAMASFYSGDAVSAVVADIGNYATKIGWAGDDFPKSYFRSVRTVWGCFVASIGSLDCCLDKKKKKKYD